MFFVGGKGRNTRGVVERCGGQSCNLYSSVSLSLSRSPTPGALLSQIDFLCHTLSPLPLFTLTLSVKAYFYEVYFSLVDFVSKTPEKGPFVFKFSELREHAQRFFLLPAPYRRGSTRASFRRT